MADPYITQLETLIYGPFACDQMKEVCMGKVPALDATVAYAILAQQQADAAMKAVLDKQPKAEPPVDAVAVLESARDTIRRFGAFLDSLKGRPLDPKVFFGNDSPSVVARRRIVKLVAALGTMHEELVKQQAKAPGSGDWIAELAQAHGDVSSLEKKQRAVKVEKVDMAPDVAAERLRWLDVYNANKLLIRGILLHAHKEELMPLIFDDLAEFHGVSGVSDEAPTPTEPAAPAIPPAPAP